MADFLTHAACCGIKPRKINASEYRHRPHLVSQLMKERLVPRFIVAPDTMGKSMLAYEYADVVFSFEHVFWLDCTSPCFLRDLDKGNLSEALFEKDCDAHLAVFDGIPLLAEERADALGDVMDTLLRHSCEVIATLVPSCDVYGGRARDRVCLSAEDLLLTDAEIDLSREMARRAGESTTRFCAPVLGENDSLRRIAGYAWGCDTGADLLAHVAKEELLGDSLAWVFLALIVRVGRAADIECMPHLKTDDLASLAADYPFLGINAAEGEFATIGIDVDVVAKSFSTSFARIAHALQLDNVEELHLVVSRCLMSLGRQIDACRYVNQAGSRAVRERWLADNGRNLLLHGVIEESCVAFSALRPRRSNNGAEACMVHAWRLQLFGESDEAQRLAARVVVSPYARSDARLYAAILMSRHGERVERKRIHATLCMLLGLLDEEQAESAAIQDGFALADLFCDESYLGEPDECMLARLCIVLHAWSEQVAQSGKARTSIRFDCLDYPDYPDSLDRASHHGDLAHSGHSGDSVRDGLRGNSAFPESPPERLWLAWQRNDVTETVLALAAIWIARECAKETCPEIIAFLQHAVETHFADDSVEGFDLIGLCSIDALELCLGEDVARKRIGVVAAAQVESARAELLRQKQAFFRVRADEARRRKDALRGALRSNLGIAPSKLETPQAIVPPLRVKLFGGMEVTIGDRVIEDTAFRRAKAKTMLALLVLAEGREVRAETLMEQMWPDASVTCARRSLYTVWSQLKKTLSLPDGSCPYVSKRQGSYRVESRYVVSDVSRANELCRGLMFQQDGVEKSRDLLEEFYDVFLGKLLPNEVENETIVRMRDDYHNRIVDILLTASTLFGREGKASDALCFASCAFEADRSREDVYLALMRAQYEAGQRVQAMNTYMACRKFLAEELGVDPSAEVENLYLSLLEDS